MSDSPDNRTNMRSIVRKEAGFVLASSSPANMRSLCESCGISSICSQKKSIERLHKKHGVLPVVKECKRFTPILTFASSKGLFAFGVNTIRLGSSWFDRLKPTDQIALVDRNSMELIRYAEVTRVARGYIDEIIDLHSVSNHTYIDEQLSSKKAAALMRDLLPNLYGKLIVRNNEFATVIYFE